MANDTTDINVLTLSKAELNKTLSVAKKKKNKKSVKIVLQTLKELTLLWLPVVDYEEFDWNVFYLLGRLGSKTDASWRKKLCLGVNITNRCLRNNDVAAVLLAPEPSLKILLNHIASQAVKNQVPIIRWKKMRELTKQSLGFECIALGVKKDAGLFQPLVELVKSSCRKVTTLSANSVPPIADESVICIGEKTCEEATTLSANSVPPVLDESVIVIGEKTCEDLTMDLEIEELPQGSGTVSQLKESEISSQSMVTTDTSSKLDSPCEGTSLLLQERNFVLKNRSNVTERVFEPSEQRHKGDDDFIRISNMDEETFIPGVSKQFRKNYYKTAQILRVTSNPDRRDNKPGKIKSKKKNFFNKKERRSFM